MVSNIKMMSLSMLVLSVIMATSSFNVLFIWFSLEINTVMFIFLTKSAKNAENLMKYFIVQEIGTMMLIMSMVFSSIKVSFETSHPNVTSSLITMSMLMKLGAAPFYHWMIQMGMSIDMSILPVFLSIQKVAPLMIIDSNLNTNILLLSIFWGGIIGSLGMLTVNKMKSLLVLSSLTHLSWLMLATSNSKEISLMYMLVYTFILMTIIQEIKKKSMVSFPSKASANNIPIMIMLWSMGGIPPMVGFGPKMMIINLMAHSKEMLIMMMLMIFFSVMSVVSYTRVIYKLLMKPNSSEKMVNKSKETSNVILHFTLVPMLILLTQTF